MTNSSRVAYLRQYYIEHKADIDTKCKAYYHAHKQEINARMLEKVQCECGASVGRSYMPKHVTTKKHMTGMMSRVR